jgi:hypothetical protein
MQRGAVRILDVNGKGFDVPFGVFTAAAPVMVYNPTTNRLEGSAVVFPGTWTANDVPYWNGTAWISKRRQLVRKTADTTVATTTPGNIPDLSFVGLKAATAYAFTFVLFFNAATSTTGLRVAVDYTGTVTSVKYGANIPRTTQTADWQAATADAGQLTATDAPTATNIATIFGCILTNGTGDLNCQFAGDAAANITCSLNSFGELQEI